jgi:hypothetical protein
MLATRTSMLATGSSMLATGTSMLATGSGMHRDVTYGHSWGSLEQAQGGVPS